MAIDDMSEKMRKGITFKTNTTDHGNQLSNATNKHINEYIPILAKNFSKVMSKLNRRYVNNVSSNIKHNQQHK